MYANFLLGNIDVSERACQTLGRLPLDLVARHAINEHGDITAREAKRNEQAMKDLGEIRSRYLVDPTNPKLGYVVVTTCETWSGTTVCLESEL